MPPMSPLAFWILAVDLFALAFVAAAFVVLLKRHVCAWAVRVWSETLNGIAEDVR